MGLHKVFADLPNTQRQTQRGSQNGRQGNKPQMKEQENSPEQELNEMETNNLSDIKFKVMIMRMLNSMKNDIETIKRTTHR